jgi:hypothetical protein
MARNQSNAYVPVREDRRVDTTSDLAITNAYHEVDLNGDESISIAFNVTSALTATVEIALSADGVNFFVAPFYALFASLGTIPVYSQPMISEVFAAIPASALRVYCIQTPNIRKVRVRYSAWTSGAAAVRVTASPASSIHPNVMVNKASTLMVSSLSAAGAALTLTLPAAPGFRHYIESIEISRVASATLTAGAATTNIATTNLPGTAANQLIFGQDAAVQGKLDIRRLDPSGVGLAATAVNTATTIVAPATTSVIWHIICIYRLGL